MNRFDLILTDAANSVGRQVKSSLERLGLRIAICDPFGGGAEFKTFHSQDTENFVGQISDIVAATGASALIPVFHPEVLSSHRNRFPGVLMPVEDASKLVLLDDKVQACNLAESLGISQPRRYASVEEVENYPVVFKRSCGHGGDSVYFPKARGPLENLVSNSRPGKYLIEECLEGEDVSVMALRWHTPDGVVFIAGAYRTLLPRAKAASIVRESIDAPDLVASFRKMLDRIDYNGVCGADFMVNEDGAFFLECNPRFCGGLDTMLASGLDFPAMLWTFASGSVPFQTYDASPILSLPEYRSGIVTALPDELEEYLSVRRRKGILTEEDERIAVLIDCL